MSIVAAILLLCLTLIVAFHYSWLDSLDIWFAETLRGNEFLQLFYFLGENWFAIAMFLLSVALVLHRRLDNRLVGFVVFNYGFMLVVNRVVKHLIERPRPEIVDQLASFSMPSGHTMASLTFALVTIYLWKIIVNKYNDSISFILVTSAVLCGLSRIADERHFFSDVLVGWSLSFLIYFFVKKWYEKGRVA